MFNANPGGAEALINALKGQRGGVQLAGDVVPLPIIPQQAPPSTGHTPLAADYAWSRVMDPQVQSIGIGTMQDWLKRAATRHSLR